MNPQPGKRFSALRYFEVQGARYFRRNADRVDAISANDPRRQTARLNITRELEDVALLAILDAERNEQRAENEKAALAAEAKERAKTEQARWRSASVSNLAGQIAFFAGATSPAVVVALSATTGAIHGAAPQYWAGLFKSKSAKPGLSLNTNALVVMVPDAEADAFRKRWDIPRTLEWTSEGKRCWMLSDDSFRRFGQRAESVNGNRFKVAAFYPRPSGKTVFAPLVDVRWHVGPDKALPKGSATLAPCPDKLAERIEVVGDGRPDAIDAAILG